VTDVGLRCDGCSCSPEEQSAVPHQSRVHLENKSLQGNFTHSSIPLKFFRNYLLYCVQKEVFISSPELPNNKQHWGFVFCETNYFDSEHAARALPRCTKHPKKYFLVNCMVCLNRMLMCVSRIGFLIENGEPACCMLCYALLRLVLIYHQVVSTYLPIYCLPSYTNNIMT
jgi:hypothetical protein